MASTVYFMEITRQNVLLRRCSAARIVTSIRELDATIICDVETW